MKFLTYQKKKVVKIKPHKTKRGRGGVVRAEVEDMDDLGEIVEVDDEGDIVRGGNE